MAKKKQPPPLPEGMQARPRRRSTKKRKAKKRRHLDLTSRQEAALMSFLNTTDDRTLAIVATSLVENDLALAIASRLRRLSPDDHNQIFDGGNAVLGSFHAKIVMGYVLGLYGREVREELHRIRRIRNAFAHHLYVRNFSSPQIRNDLRKLEGAYHTYWAISEDDTRWPITRNDKFKGAVEELIRRFAAEARKPKRPKRPMHHWLDLSRATFHEIFVRPHTPMLRKPD